MRRTHNVPAIGIEANRIDDCIMKQFKDGILAKKLDIRCSLFLRIECVLALLQDLLACVFSFV